MPKVIVQSLPDYTFAQVLTTEGHSLIADEPLDEDGNNLGPTPYDLLLWALGACTLMTIQLYARRKGYPLEEVAVEVEHKHTHIDDCLECVATEGASGAIQVMYRRIVLKGPLSDEQRDDLLRVAKKCPIHKTLLSQPQILDTIDVV